MGRGSSIFERHLLDRAHDGCSQWSCWFAFFLLVCMLVTCFLNAFERARFIYLTYLALLTSLLTITSRNFITATVLSYYNNNGTFNIKDTKQSANNAAAAGAIMLCITNYALIIFIGLGGSQAFMRGPMHMRHDDGWTGVNGPPLDLLPISPIAGASASQQASMAMQQPEQKYAPTNF